MESWLGNNNIKPKHQIFKSKSRSFLIEKTLSNGTGVLSKDGALIVETGSHTGRSAKDKYLVKNSITEKTIDWSHDVHVMTTETFNELKSWAIDQFNDFDSDLYLSRRSVSSEPKYNLPAVLLSTSPHHNLFFNNMFRPYIENHGLEPFYIYHLPYHKADKEKFGLQSQTCITMDFSTREIIIVGTAYAGEIKKSIFSVMNYILPEKGVLPMHSGANVGLQNNTSVFFGLSGTGKTTLSTDEGMKLIGDDEHGLSDEGVFNFEGGCYAKTINLSKENEPDIWKCCHRYGTMLENVVYDKNERTLDFDDDSLTQNGRASYPLEFIEDSIPESQGPVAKDIFFLTADAFGVLPPASKLSREQAMYYFLSGYTAKVAGTEIGIKEPQATFSTCFGGPFMMRHPKEYGELLGKYVEKHNINVWLINTGWTGGAYGEGERFPIKVTRQIIRSIQTGKVNNNTKFESDEFFGLNMPTEIEGVESFYLNPRNTWKDKTAFDNMAKKLAGMFHENFKQYTNMDSGITNGGPIYK